MFENEAMRAGRVSADQDFVVNIDRLNHGRLAVDESGNVFYPALIPNATYRFSTPDYAKDFVAKSGETFEIGQVRVAEN